MSTNAETYKSGRENLNKKSVVPLFCFTLGLYITGFILRKQSGQVQQETICKYHPNS